MKRLQVILVLLVLAMPMQAQTINMHDMPHAKEITLPGMRDKGGKLHFAPTGMLFYLGKQQLLRYDGFQWKQFNQRKTQSSVQLLAVASYDGAIWVGTNQGKLLHTKNDSLVPAKPQIGKEPSEITHLVSHRNYLFIAKAGEGLWRWNGKQASPISGLENLDVICVVSHNDRLLLSTEAGLFELKSNKDEQMWLVDVSNEPLISTILLKDDDIWLGFQSGGIAKLSGSQIHHQPFPDDDQIIKMAHVNDALWTLDKSGHLWSYSLKDGQTSRLLFPGGTKAGRITDLATDQQQNVWISTTNGLYLIYPGWKVHTLPFDLHVQAVAKLGNGQLVVGTNAGCYIFDERQGWRAVKNNQKQINILSLARDSEKGLWVGTYGQGLWQINSNGELIRPLKQSNADYNSNVFSIEPGDEENTWFLGTLGGIYLLRQEAKKWKVVPYKHELGPGQYYIFDLLRDTNGVLWVATDGKGIYAHKDGQFATNTSPPVANLRIVSSLAIDNAGNLWASSPEGRLSKRSISGWETRQLVLDGAINVIQPTSINNVLLGSENGLWLYQLSDSTIFPLDKMYDLPALAFSTNALFKEGDKVWLGANNSVLEGQLELFGAVDLPEIYLEKPTHLNGLVLPESMSFSANSNDLRFQFQVPWFYNTDLLYMRYKLHGLHGSWVETEKREIVLQSLSPGNYELEIQVALDPTFKRVRVVRQTFEIRKPFYTTWWFVLLVTLGLILLMRQILAWREQKRMLQNQTEKEKIRAQYEILKSQISPHFLFNAFNTLSQLIDVDSQKASKYVDQLALVFRKVLHFRDQELISLREEMSLVEAYIHLQQQRFENKLRVSIQIPEAAFELLVVPMSIQLLVENAVKHNVISSTKPLSISLLVKGETIIVQNNLQPKKQPEPSTGFGLSSLQSRYRQDLGQMLQIERDDQYFTVTLPLLQPNP